MTPEQQISEIEEFHELMLEELESNMWKGGWHADSVEALLNRVYEELMEVQDELAKRGSPDFDLLRVYSECADVANMIAMVASRVKMGILGESNVSVFASGQFDHSARLWPLQETAQFDGARPQRSEGDALPTRES